MHTFSCMDDKHIEHEYTAESLRIFFLHSAHKEEEEEETRMKECFCILRERERD